MSTGYASPEEHLDDLLALLRSALAVAVERKRGADENTIAVSRSSPRTTKPPSTRPSGDD
jgi:hypothetical protein